MGLCVTNNYTEFHREIQESHREKNSKMELNTITEKIIGCAIEVHKVLGPGLLESAYEECLTYECFCPVHEAQILTYLKFSKKRIGLLVNFNVTVLKNGIKRYRM